MSTILYDNLKVIGNFDLRPSDINALNVIRNYDVGVRINVGDRNVNEFNVNRV